MRVWLCLLLIPSVAAIGIEDPAEPVDATLVIHMDGQQEMQLSVTEPPPQWTSISGGGLVGSNCIETPAQSLTTQEHHTWYGVLSPTPPNYDPDPRTNARGLRGDLVLPAQTMGFTWYLTTEAGGIAQDVPMPQTTVRFTLREGDALSVNNQALNAGRIVASAESEAVTLSPQTDHPQVTVHDVDGRTVYGIHVDVQVQDQVIPQDVGINLRVDLFVDHPGCPEGQYTAPMTYYAASHHGLRPQIDLRHALPVTIDRLVAIVDDELRVAAVVRAPFGSADAILSSNGHVSVDGDVLLEPAVWRGDNGTGRAHPPSHVATDTYRFDGAWPLPAKGDHELRFTVRTEGGAEAVAVLPITVGSGVQECTVIRGGEPTCGLQPTAGKKSPAGMLAVAGLVAAAALRRR